LLRSEVVR